MSAPGDNDPAANGSTAPDGGERVFYRSLDEFNRALDKAAETIGYRDRPGAMASMLWIGLFFVQAFLYIADWAFDWEVREQIIPGVDLTRIIWVLIVVMAMVFHFWTRSKHGGILRNRLCFQCGWKLLDVPADEHGDGRCPECARAFNLGEYRRPEENRGRSFRGYIDRDHFDKAMYAAEEHLRFVHGSMEGVIVGWLWMLLGISFVTNLLVGWSVFDWLPVAAVPYHGIWFALMCIWSGIYALRVQRRQPLIAAQRLCLNCGYSLLGTEVDGNGFGRCPECGGEFDIRQYEPPRRTEKAR